MQFVKGATAKGKRGPTEDLEGPRRKDPDGEPREEGGLPSAAAGEANSGEPTPTEARGAEPGDAAAAAGERDDVRPEEDDRTHQPGQGGGETDGRPTLTQRPTGTAARKARTAAGLDTVAEDEEDGLEAAAAPAGTGAAAAAHGAAGGEETFEEMIEGYPGSFWSAVEDDGIRYP